MTDPRTTGRRPRPKGDDLALARHRFAAAKYTLCLANRTGRHKGYYLRRYQAALAELRLTVARVEGYLSGLTQAERTLSATGRARRTLSATGRARRTLT